MLARGFLRGSVRSVKLFIFILIKNSLHLRLVTDDFLVSWVLEMLTHLYNRSVQWVLLARHWSVQIALGSGLYFGGEC